MRAFASRAVQRAWRQRAPHYAANLMPYRSKGCAVSTYSCSVRLDRRLWQTRQMSRAVALVHAFMSDMEKSNIQTMCGVKKGIKSDHK
jgi:hypothetical protein